MKYNTLPSIFNDFDAFFKPVTATDYFLDEDQTGFNLSLDLPGVKKEDLKVEINQGILSVKAEAKTRGKIRTYSRSFNVPDSIKIDAVEAELMDGVLMLKMPKQEEKVAKLIKIK